MKRSISVLVPLTLWLAGCTDDSASGDGSSTSDPSTGQVGSDDTAADPTEAPADDSGSSGSPEPTGTTGDEPLQVFEACEDFEITITEPNPMLVWTPNAIRLVSEELAPGVFAVHDANAADYEPMGLPLATSGGFVIGDEGVLLVESMINRQLLCQLEDLVREQTDLPVRYVVNTSYHGDHSYGNAFLPESVQVVQHERTAQYIASYFEEDVAFMEGNFGTDQGLDEVVPVTADVQVTDDGWSVDLGGMTVEARYLGFGQTEGDLFVYVPQAQVLWTGNPLIAEAPAIPWLLDGRAEDVATTLAAVQASLPGGAIVVPGHGRPTTVGTFDFSIDYLGTMLTEVQAAIDSGATVEETVGLVSMERFQGYALWGWVHSVVNVPNTYAELAP